MKLVIKSLALAIAAAGLAAPALADTATTKGGFQIKSDDGNFEAKLGGRIHFDGNLYQDNKTDGLTNDKSNSQFFFRRARITLEGKAYDWNFKFENDFATSSEELTSTATTKVCSAPSGTDPGVGGCPTGSKPVDVLTSASTKGNEGIREMWIGRKVLGDNNLRIGQAKPYRGMEELTSSNEITFMERSFATATGIYNNQFTTGIFLDGSGEGYGYGASVYTPRSVADRETQGLGYNVRGFVVPVRSNGNLVHIGLSASQDNFETNTTSKNVRVVGRENGLRSGNVITASAFNEQTTYAAELAARFGGVYMQSEYAKSTYKDTLGVAPFTADQDVDTYYVQASYFLTEHTKPYDFKKGVFKSPKLDGEEGAIELKVRFDKIENKDLATRPEASYYAIGVNYYATPNTRFMVEYVDGKAETTTTKLDAAAITARAQYNF
ncbi:MAG: porin [Pseudomonadota bacterium]